MTGTYRIRCADTWAQARDDYIAGMDAGSVCRRYDLGLSAFRRRARKYGWRRLDQPDPAPGVNDLGIYEDIEPNEQIHTAYLRFIEALESGRVLQAMRWRRLWSELCDERNRLEADIFADLSPAEVAAVWAEDAAAAEAEDEALLLGPPVRPALTGPAEKVHDVHPNSRGVHFSPAPALSDPAPSALAGDPPPDALAGLEHRHAEGRGGQPEGALGGHGGGHGGDQAGLPPGVEGQRQPQADPAAGGDRRDHGGQGPQQPAALADRARGRGGGGGFNGHGRKLL